MCLLLECIEYRDFVFLNMTFLGSISLWFIIDPIQVFTFRAESESLT